jgi:PAS domain S-box-containing protein
MMRERLNPFLRPPIFPADEDKTFVAGLLHVILWSLLAGICLYTFIATSFSFIQPDMLLIAWLYVLSLGGLAVALMAVMRRGYVRAAAIAVNLGLWSILTVAVFFNGGVVAPAYSGYMIVIVATSLLVSWQWGLVAATASTVTGAIFLLAANNGWLPEWQSHYNFGSVWSANVTYFFVAVMLLALALRAIKRASQQARREMAERLKTEEALRHSEQRFRAIFDSVNDAIFVQDLTDGRILEVNQATCEMYGYTMDEIRHLTIEDLSAGEAPHTQQEAVAWIQKAAADEPQIFEWRAKDSRGRLFWVEVNMRRAAIDGHDRLLVVVRDIDERKRAEQHLQLKEESLRLALEAARMSTWDWHATTDHWSWSDNIGETFGWQAIEPVGTFASFLDQVVEEDRQRVSEVVAQALTGQGDRFMMEHRVRWPDGSIHWLEDRGQVFRDAHGQPVRVTGTIGEITDRKRMEADLARERDLLQALMDNFPDTIYFKDTASRFTRINRSQARLLGVAEPEEAIGKTDADFFSAELAQMFLDEEQRLMTAGEPIIDRMEYNPTPEGQPRWFSASKVPLKDRAGQVIGLVGISRDITDRRLMEESLRESQARFGSAFEHAAVGMALVAPDHSIMQVNRAFCQLLGYEPAEVVGQPFGGLTHPADAAISEEYHRRLFAGELETYQFEKRYLHRQGQIVWAWLTVSVVYDTGKRPRYAIAQIQDVTERKRAEEALRASEERYRRLVEVSPVAMWINQDGIITYMNPAALRILGATDLQQVVGRAALDFIHPDYHTLVKERISEMVDREQIVPLAEEKYVRLDGSVVDVEVTATPFTTVGGRAMQVLFQDITERKRAEERERRTSQGLRAVIEAVDELMSCADLDTLYRRAVELAREKLKVERCGLFTLDEQGWLRGTYGTDLQRQTTDERGAHFQPTNVTGLNDESDLLWTITESEHSFWEGDQLRVSGAGWVGATFIRTRDRVVGVLYNDTAITHTPADEAQQEVLAVYCSLLGSLIELKRAEEALRESESTTRALLDAIPDAIFRFDAQGVFKDFIPAKNFAALLPPQAFIGRHYTQVLPPEMVQQLADNFQMVMTTGEPRLYEYAVSVGGRSHFLEARLVKMAQGDVLGIVRDVTDRKQAEQALQQREAYLRSILDNFPYWIWLKDTTGHFLAVNKTLANTYGYEHSDDLVGKTDDDLTSPELARQYRADDAQVMESRRPKLREEIVRERGGERWYETFKSPVFDAQGNVIGTAGFAHDITARRQAEEAMRESEALFRNLADNAPALIAMSDEHGHATYLNQAWRDFRGDVPALPLDEWAERIHPTDRSRFLHEFRSALQAQRKFTTEYRLRRVDGQYRWLLDTSVPRYGAAERFAGFIGIAIDITDRKNAEEALRRSESRLRLLADNMVDSIAQLDAHQRLVYVSPSVERSFGHSPRDLLGRPLFDIVHPEDGSRLYHQMLMAIELQAPSLRLEYRLRHANGQYLWSESEVRLLYDERGEFSGAVLSSRDISARKAADLERERLIVELEEKNTELERFTYTVSHDLKSPLITIRGFLGFLEKDALAGNLDRLRADIVRITEATTRMQRLLDELLELSRIGRVGNPPEEVALEQIAREALGAVQGRIMARGVQVEIAEDLPVVYGDRTRLVEVVQNLVDNAVKFMGNQPQPRVTIGALGIERSGMPVFFVQDNGIGIEPEYHERIFGLFNKLDVKSEGTGVGLALVKRIIDSHGGHIWVESEGAGQGSTFFFTLPRPAPGPRKS